MDMLKDFVNMCKIPQLQKKVFFTLLVVVAYRIGTVIPIPGIDIGVVKSMFAAQKSGFLDFLNVFSGGALNRMSIFSLGVMPYINASIIMSLIQGAHLVPYLDKLAREGEYGRKKLSKITKLMTLVIGTMHSFGLVVALTRMSTPEKMCVVVYPSSSWIVLTVATLVTGTILIMWLGEQITERGIGNGVSLVIFSGIVERLPHAVIDIVKLMNMEELSALVVLILTFVVIGVLVLVVWVETAQRRVPIHYAKKVVGRKMYGGQTSFLPIKVDQSGLIAVIFSVSILSAPLALAQFTPNWTIWKFSLTKKIEQWFTSDSVIYNLVYVSFIIFFCYFYNSISFNPKELAENMKKSAGFIPGIRPGESTSVYIQKILERITLSGALFVAFLAVLPDYLRSIMKAPFFFGGTSLLIVVGVSLDTIEQIGMHLIMRHYEGFVKDGGIKGRWFNVKK
ncbi:MAG: preprotein translocase subunit SecY [Endomicrobium sp.]|jgi:preprotein translocase subunit SecY|nr:preprotein translocase subunit SecY [Endomicrobium sp.]